jgi:hypothetical protein
MPVAPPCRQRYALGTNTTSLSRVVSSDVYVSRLDPSSCIAHVSRDFPIIRIVSTVNAGTPPRVVVEVTVVVDMMAV